MQATLTTNRRVRRGLTPALGLMKIPLHDGPVGLEELVNRCTADLFSDVQYTFMFPAGCSLQHWPVEEIKESNSAFLANLRNSANIYAIFVRPEGAADEWIKVYVGQRKSSGLRDRITHHLIKKHDQTGSMLEAVRTAVAAGNKIGLSFVKVQPEPLRLFVEESIISRYKQVLPWNTHG